MKTIEIKEAAGPLAGYAQGLEEEPLILMLDGKPVAALVAIENADTESVSLSSNPQFLALIERSRSRRKEQGGISSSEMRHRLDIGS
ncbi:MAG: hypothetical protein IT210_07595 [Armatimonadetes bacterium]|nr:hypothetical protein [Armatimonadota bacterium]